MRFVPLRYPFIDSRKKLRTDRISIKTMKLSDKHRIKDKESDRHKIPSA